MATKLKTFDWNTKHSSGNNPLDEFLDGNIWKLTDEDREATGIKISGSANHYHTLESFRIALYNRARGRGKKLKYRKVPENNAVVIQCFERSEGLSNGKS